MESSRLLHIRSRHRRIRSKVYGTVERPRLAVFRSLRHIAAQLIDDTAGRTIIAASDRDVPDTSKVTVAVAHSVGTLMAERAKKKGIRQIVFDRGGQAYHGQVQSLAEGAREGGLEF